MQVRERCIAGKGRYRFCLMTGPSPLLLTQWTTGIYVDAVLLVGLCLASKIFAAIADSLPWITRYRGVELVCDILMGGHTGTSVNKVSISLSRHVWNSMFHPQGTNRRISPAVSSFLRKGWNI